MKKYYMCDECGVLVPCYPWDTVGLLYCLRCQKKMGGPYTLEKIQMIEEEKERRNKAAFTDSDVGRKVAVKEEYIENVISNSEVFDQIYSAENDFVECLTGHITNKSFTITSVNEIDDEYADIKITFPMIIEVELSVSKEDIGWDDK
jgi:hypothetical protein